MSRSDRTGAGTCSKDEPLLERWLQVMIRRTLLRASSSSGRCCPFYAFLRRREVEVVEMYVEALAKRKNVIRLVRIDLRLPRQDLGTTFHRCPVKRQGHPEGTKCRCRPRQANLTEAVRMNVYSGGEFDVRWLWCSTFCRSASVVSYTYVNSKG